MWEKHVGALNPLYNIKWLWYEYDQRAWHDIWYQFDSKDMKLLLLKQDEQGHISKRYDIKIDQLINMINI